MTTDGSIGRNNDLIYKIRDDHRRFKKLTSGGTVVMGRATWESLPVKPLPGRRNIVLTHGDIDDAETARSIEDVLETAGTGENVWVIGGGSVYSAFLPYVDRVEITRVKKPGRISDVKFPDLKLSEWDIRDTSEDLYDKDCDVLYCYQVAVKKP